MIHVKVSIKVFVYWRACSSWRRRWHILVCQQVGVLSATNRTTGTASPVGQGQELGWYAMLQRNFLWGPSWCKARKDGLTQYIITTSKEMYKEWFLLLLRMREVTSSSQEFWNAGPRNTTMIQGDWNPQRIFFSSIYSKTHEGQTGSVSNYWGTQHGKGPVVKSH